MVAMQDYHMPLSAVSLPALIASPNRDAGAAANTASGSPQVASCPTRHEIALPPARSGAPSPSATIPSRVGSPSPTKVKITSEPDIGRSAAVSTAITNKGRVFANTIDRWLRLQSSAEAAFCKRYPPHVGCRHGLRGAMDLSSSPATDIADGNLALLLLGLQHCGVNKLVLPATCVVEKWHATRTQAVLDFVRCNPSIVEVEFEGGAQPGALLADLKRAVRKNTKHIRRHAQAAQSTPVAISSAMQSRIEGLRAEADGERGFIVGEEMKGRRSIAAACQMNKQRQVRAVLVRELSERHAVERSRLCLEGEAPSRQAVLREEYAQTHRLFVSFAFRISEIILTEEAAQFAALKRQWRRGRVEMEQEEHRNRQRALDERTTLETTESTSRLDTAAVEASSRHTIMASFRLMGKSAKEFERLRSAFDLQESRRLRAESDRRDNEHRQFIEQLRLEGQRRAAEHTRERDRMLVKFNQLAYSQIYQRERRELQYILVLRDQYLLPLVQAQHAAREAERELADLCARRLKYWVDIRNTSELTCFRYLSPSPGRGFAPNTDPFTNLVAGCGPLVSRPTQEVEAAVAKARGLRTRAHNLRMEILRRLHHGVCSFADGSAAVEMTPPPSPGVPGRRSRSIAAVADLPPSAPLADLFSATGSTLSKLDVPHGELLEYVLGLTLAGRARSELGGGVGPSSLDVLFPQLKTEEYPIPSTFVQQRLRVRGIHLTVRAETSVGGTTSTDALAESGVVPVQPVLSMEWPLAASDHEQFLWNAATRSTGAKMEGCCGWVLHPPASAPCALTDELSLSTRCFDQTCEGWDGAPPDELAAADGEGDVVDTINKGEEGILRHMEAVSTAINVALQSIRLTPTLPDLDLTHLGDAYFKHLGLLPASFLSCSDALGFCRTAPHLIAPHIALLLEVRLEMSELAIQPGTSGLTPTFPYTAEEAGSGCKGIALGSAGQGELPSPHDPHAGRRFIGAFAAPSEGSAGAPTREVLRFKRPVVVQVRQPPVLLPRPVPLELSDPNRLYFPFAALHDALARRCVAGVVFFSFNPPRTEEADGSDPEYPGNCGILSAVLFAPVQETQAGVATTRSRPRRSKVGGGQGVRPLDDVLLPLRAFAAGSTASLMNTTSCTTTDLSTALNAETPLPWAAYEGHAQRRVEHQADGGVFVVPSADSGLAVLYECPPEDGSRHPSCIVGDVSETGRSGSAGPLGPSLGGEGTSLPYKCISSVVVTLFTALVPVTNGADDTPALCLLPAIDIPHTLHTTTSPPDDDGVVLTQCTLTLSGGTFPRALCAHLSKGVAVNRPHRTTCLSAIATSLECRANAGPPMHYRTVEIVGCLSLEPDGHELGIWDASLRRALLIHTEGEEEVHTSVGSPTTAALSPASSRPLSRMGPSGPRPATPATPDRSVPAPSSAPHPIFTPNRVSGIQSPVRGRPPQPPRPLPPLITPNDFRPTLGGFEHVESCSDAGSDGVFGVPSSGSTYSDSRALSEAVRLTNTAIVWDVECNQTTLTHTGRTPSADDFSSLILAAKGDPLLDAEAYKDSATTRAESVVALQSRLSRLLVGSFRGSIRSSFSKPLIPSRKTMGNTSSYLVVRSPIAPFSQLDLSVEGEPWSTPTLSHVYSSRSQRVSLVLRVDLSDDRGEVHVGLQPPSWAKHLFYVDGSLRIPQMDSEDIALGEFRLEDICAMYDALMCPRFAAGIARAVEFVISLRADMPVALCAHLIRSIRYRPLPIAPPSAHRSYDTALSDRYRTDTLSLAIGNTPPTTVLIRRTNAACDYFKFLGTRPQGGPFLDSAQYALLYAPTLRPDDTRGPTFPLRHIAPCFARLRSAVLRPSSSAEAPHRWFGDDSGSSMRGGSAKVFVRHADLGEDCLGIFAPKQRPVGHQGPWLSIELADVTLAPRDALTPDGGGAGTHARRFQGCTSTILQTDAWRLLANMYIAQRQTALKDILEECLQEAVDAKLTEGKPEAKPVAPPWASRFEGVYLLPTTPYEPLTVASIQAAGGKKKVMSHDLEAAIAAASLTSALVAVNNRLFPVHPQSVWAPEAATKISQVSGPPQWSMGFLSRSTSAGHVLPVEAATPPPPAPATHFAEMFTHLSGRLGAPPGGCKGATMVYVRHEGMRGLKRTAHLMYPRVVPTGSVAASKAAGRVHTEGSWDVFATFAPSTTALQSAPPSRRTSVFRVPSGMDGPAPTYPVSSHSNARRRKSLVTHLPQAITAASRASRPLLQRALRKMITDRIRRASCFSGSSSSDHSDDEEPTGSPVEQLVREKMLDRRRALRVGSRRGHYRPQADEDVDTAITLKALFQQQVNTQQLRHRLPLAHLPEATVHYHIMMWPEVAGCAAASSRSSSDFGDMFDDEPESTPPRPVVVGTLRRRLAEVEVTIANSPEAQKVTVSEVLRLLASIGYQCTPAPRNRLSAAADAAGLMHEWLNGSRPDWSDKDAPVIPSQLVPPPDVLRSYVCEHLPKPPGVELWTSKQREKSAALQRLHSQVLEVIRSEHEQLEAWIRWLQQGRPTTREHKVVDIVVTPQNGNAIAGEVSLTVDRDGTVGWRAANTHSSMDALLEAIVTSRCGGADQQASRRASDNAPSEAPSRDAVAMAHRMVTTSCGSVMPAPLCTFLPDVNLFVTERRQVDGPPNDAPPSVFLSVYRTSHHFDPGLSSLATVDRSACPQSNAYRFFRSLPASLPNGVEAPPPPAPRSEPVRLTLQCIAALLPTVGVAAVGKASPQTAPFVSPSISHLRASLSLSATVTPGEQTLGLSSSTNRGTPLVTSLRAKSMAATVSSTTKACYSSRDLANLGALSLFPFMQATCEQSGPSSWGGRTVRIAIESKLVSAPSGSVFPREAYLGAVRDSHPMVPSGGRLERRVQTARSVTFFAYNNQSLASPGGLRDLASVDTSGHGDLLTSLLRGTDVAGNQTSPPPPLTTDELLLIDAPQQVELKRRMDVWWQEQQLLRAAYIYQDDVRAVGAHMISRASADALERVFPHLAIVEMVPSLSQPALIPPLANNASPAKGPPAALQLVDAEVTLSPVQVAKAVSVAATEGLTPRTPRSGGTLSVASTSSATWDVTFEGNYSHTPRGGSEMCAFEVDVECTRVTFSPSEDPAESTATVVVNERVRGLVGTYQLKVGYMVPAEDGPYDPSTTTFMFELLNGEKGDVPGHTRSKAEVRTALQKACDRVNAATSAPKAPAPSAQLAASTVLGSVCVHQVRDRAFQTTGVGGKSSQWTLLSDCVSTEMSLTIPPSQADGSVRDEHIIAFLNAIGYSTQDFLPAGEASQRPPTQDAKRLSVALANPVPVSYTPLHYQERGWGGEAFYPSVQLPPTHTRMYSSPITMATGPPQLAVKGGLTTTVRGTVAVLGEAATVFDGFASVCVAVTMPKPDNMSGCTRFTRPLASIPAVHGSIEVRIVGPATSSGSDRGGGTAAAPSPYAPALTGLLGGPPPDERSCYVIMDPAKVNNPFPARNVAGELAQMASVVLEAVDLSGQKETLRSTEYVQYLMVLAAMSGLPNASVPLSSLMREQLMFVGTDGSVVTQQGPELHVGGRRVGNLSAVSPSYMKVDFNWVDFVAPSGQATLASINSRLTKLVAAVAYNITANSPTFHRLMYEPFTITPEVTVRPSVAGLSAFNSARQALTVPRFARQLELTLTTAESTDPTRCAPRTSVVKAVVTAQLALEPVM